MSGVSHYPDMWTTDHALGRTIHVATVLKLNLPAENSLGGTDLKVFGTSSEQCFMTRIYKISLSNLKHEVTVFPVYISSPKTRNPHILKDHPSDLPALPAKHSRPNDQPWLLCLTYALATPKQDFYNVPGYAPLWTVAPGDSSSMAERYCLVEIRYYSCGDM